jgi:mono/diheme cytochrome c family protein
MRSGTVGETDRSPALSPVDFTHPTTGDPRSTNRHRWALIAGLLPALIVAVAAAAPGGENDRAAGPLARRIRPVLSRCAECHAGEDAAGGLDLTSRPAALRGGDSGPAIRPRDAAGSLVYRKVAAGKMPPKKRLAPDEVALVRAWLEAGAEWEGVPVTPPGSAGQARLWALRPLTHVEPPAVSEGRRIADPIDDFILARLERAGLTPAAPADRRTLIRRATFDLLGLPPTPEEIDAFLADDSPAADERLIDRLLASPHYGERWGRHWLDVARFAESNGFEHDKLREQAWPYRDYVIASLNADRTYTQFVREQIAGDVLEPATRDGIAATGFLVAGPWDEANQIQKSVTMRQRVREEELEDMVAAVGQVFLGLTVNCARCHDHKFDPIRQRDYYRIKAALEGVLHGNRPMPSGMVYAACSKDVTPPTFVLARGDVEQPGERVAAGGLSAVRSPSPEFGLAPDAPEDIRRRKLADWVADPANPLTARVIVNRIWHYHFGTGLVATPNDLGRNGDRPSHPELLDWLAADFVAHGTSLKALHRRIMLSDAYRRSSRSDPKAAAVDADDRLLWRYPSRRLEAEAIRDAMLTAAGQIHTRMGGPSFRPFVLKVFNSNFYELADFAGPEYDRRTVYRININSAKDPLLETLDCPDPSVKTPRRAVTTTPLQALGLMNDPFVLRQARALAARVRSEAPCGLAAQVERMFRLTLGRTPDGPEGERAARLVRGAGLEELAWTLFNSSEFLYVR